MHTLWTTTLSNFIVTHSGFVAVYMYFSYSCFFLLYIYIVYIINTAVVF